MRRSFTLCLLLLGCAAEADPPGSDLGAALARAGARGTLVLAHFRVPGRPLSDAMDANLAAAPAALLSGFEQVRIDAQAEPDAYRRVLGGSARRGPGLATCVLAPDGTTLAEAPGYLDPAGVAAFVAEAVRLRADLAAALCALAADPGAAGPRLALADAHAQLGRRAAARTGLRAVHAETGEPWRSAAAARLARLAVDEGDLEDARTWLSAIAPGTGLDASVALTTGRLLLAGCEPRAARTSLESALQAYPDHADLADLLLALGQARHETGADADALATFADVATRFPAVAARARELAEHVRSGAGTHTHGDERP